MCPHLKNKNKSIKKEYIHTKIDETSDNDNAIRNHMKLCVENEVCYNQL